MLIHAYVFLLRFYHVCGVVFKGHVNANLHQKRIVDAYLPRFCRVFTTLSIAFSGKVLFDAFL